MSTAELVGDFFMEIIIPWLIVVPGALIRWLIAKISGTKKTFRDYYSAGSFLTGLTGVLFWVAFILWIIYT